MFPYKHTYVCLDTRLTNL